MAGVVVLKVSLMDRAGRLAQRVRRQIPHAGIAQQMHAELRRVLHRVLRAPGSIALPGDDEHIADADVVDHVAPGRGQAVPALIFHIGFHPVQSARRDAVKRD